MFVSEGKGIYYTCPSLPPPQEALKHLNEEQEELRMEVEHELREELDLTQNTIRKVLSLPTFIRAAIQVWNSAL